MVVGKQTTQTVVYVKLEYILMYKRKRNKKKKKRSGGWERIAETQVGFHQKVGRNGSTDPLDGSHAFNMMR